MNNKIVMLDAKMFMYTERMSDLETTISDTISKITSKIIKFIETKMGFSQNLVIE